MRQSGEGKSISSTRCSFFLPGLLQAGQGFMPVPFLRVQYSQEREEFMAAPFTDLIRSLLSEGRVCLRQPPQMRPDEREPVTQLLSRAYRDHALGVAGPPIDF